MSQNWDARTKAHQAIRLRRLLMTLGSYGCTFTLVLVCYGAGLLQLTSVIQYAAGVAAINVLFYWLISSGRNLKLADPDMTTAQMLLSVVPALYVMYFVGTPQARGSFLLLSVAPLLYGMFGLTTARFVAIGVLIYASCIGLILLLLHLHPERVDPRGDLVQLIALLGSLLQIALIGGNISELRAKLRKRTNELNQALTTISEMANRDELTSVYNRRYLLKYLENEILHCNRGAGPLCVCLLDIDYFKRVNDTHGHLAGDIVLTKVAGAINGDLRKIDCFGRYGGEEFLLVLPQTQGQGAHFKVDKLRTQIKALDLSEIAPDFRITLSAGIAEYQAGETLVQFIARADGALYRAKEQGRDRALLAGECELRKVHGL